MRELLFAAGISGALGVILGAFGAHALRERLGPQMLATFETGVRYQLIHALALLAVAILLARWPASSWLHSAGVLFVAGTVLFSGSLYLLVFTGARWLGMVAPLGGAAFIAGWLCLAIAAIHARSG